MSYKSIIKSKSFKLLFSIIILAILFYFIDFNLFFESIKNLRSIFIWAVLLIPFSIFIRALRWKIIINEDKALVGNRDAFFITLVGITLNIFLPAGMGDVAKSYYGFKWHGSKEEMLSASLADKTIALFAIFFLGSVSAILIGNYDLGVFSTILTIISLAVIFRSDKLPWNLINKYSLRFLSVNFDPEKLKNTFSISHRNKAITIFLSIIASSITFLQLYIVCLSFQVDVSLFYVFAIAPLLNIAILFPLTLNGLGSGETAMVILLGVIGVSPTISVAISLFSQLLYSFIPGFFGLLVIIKKNLS